MENRNNIVTTSEHPERNNRNWGRWYLDLTPPASLNIPFGCYIYDIALSRCKTEHDRELWLKQMQGKRRELISSQDLADLKRAFNDLKAEELI